MSYWMKVITDPLGFCGFVIFLIFFYLAAKPKRRKPETPSLLLFAIGAAGLAGGLFLAHEKIQTAGTSGITTGDISQTTEKTKNVTAICADKSQSVKGGQITQNATNAENVTGVNGNCQK